MKKLGDLSKALEKTLKSYDVVETTFAAMIEKQLRIEEFEKYLDQVIPLPARSDNQSNVKIAYIEQLQETRELCRIFFDEGNPLDPTRIRHSLWSAYNVITWMADFRLAQPAKIRVTDPTMIWRRFEPRDLEKRLSRLWFGDASHLKNRAFHAAANLITPNAA